tara:strand:- start:218 stop:508 length:291 start_codon:yes stop_codon:yes gene_type:complete
MNKNKNKNKMIDISSQSKRKSNKNLLDSDKLKDITYEEAIEKIDAILTDMQNEDVPIDKLQEYYILGNIYIKRCQDLLDEFEQEIIEINCKENYKK